MEFLKIRYKGNEGAKTATLVFKKECNIYHVDGFYRRIKAELDKHVIDTVILEDISNIDLAGAQFLISLRRKLAEMNPGIMFQAGINEETKLLIDRSGLHDIFNN